MYGDVDPVVDDELDAATRRRWTILGERYLH